MFTMMDWRNILDTKVEFCYVIDNRNTFYELVWENM